MRKIIWYTQIQESEQRQTFLLSYTHVFMPYQIENSVEKGFDFVSFSSPTLCNQGLSLKRLYLTEQCRNPLIFLTI